MPPTRPRPDGAPTDTLVLPSSVSPWSPDVMGESLPFGISEDSTVSPPGRGVPNLGTLENLRLWVSSAGRSQTTRHHSVLADEGGTQGVIRPPLSPYFPREEKGSRGFMWG